MAGNDKKSPKPVHKDRFLGYMFLRGDSVILVVKIGGQMFPWVRVAESDYVPRSVGFGSIVPPKVLAYNGP